MEEAEASFCCRVCGGEIYAGELYWLLPCGPCCRDCLRVMTRLAE